MAKFLLWCCLFVLCWPLAIFALIAYPLLWLLTLPLRLVGVTLEAIFELVGALVTLPFRVLRTVLA